MQADRVPKRWRERLGHALAGAVLGGLVAWGLLEWVPEFESRIATLAAAILFVTAIFVCGLLAAFYGDRFTRTLSDWWD